MHSHPVNVPRHTYRGSDPRKRASTAEYNRVVGLVEKHLQSEMAKAPDDSLIVFISDTIALAIGQDRELIRDIVSGIDGGANGVTLYKGDFSRALRR